MTDPMVFTLSSVHQVPPTPEILRLQKFQRTFQMQFACAVAYFVAVVLYLPVGLAVVQDFKRLSIQEVRSTLWSRQLFLSLTRSCTCTVPGSKPR